MNQDEEILDENSIGDLLDEDTNIHSDEEEGEFFDVKPAETTQDDDDDKPDEEEELLSAETEFGEDPEYDDSVDDYDGDL